MRYAEVTDMKRIFGGTLTLKNGRIDKYQFDEGYCQAEKYIYNTSQDDFTFCYYDQNHVKYLLLISVFFFVCCTESRVPVIMTEEKEADANREKFNEFNKFIRNKYGKNALQELFKSDFSDSQKVRQIDSWWKEFNENGNAEKDLF